MPTFPINLWSATAEKENLLIFIYSVARTEPELQILSDEWIRKIQGEKQQSDNNEPGIFLSSKEK